MSSSLNHTAQQKIKIKITSWWFSILAGFLVCIYATGMYVKVLSLGPFR